MRPILHVLLKLPVQSYARETASYRKRNAASTPSALFVNRRWCNVLDPSIKRDEWAEHELRILFEAQQELGNVSLLLFWHCHARCAAAVRTKLSPVSAPPRSIVKVILLTEMVRNCQTLAGKARGCREEHIL